MNGINQIQKLKNLDYKKKIMIEDHQFRLKIGRKDLLISKVI